MLGERCRRGRVTVTRRLWLWVRFQFEGMKYNLLTYFHLLALVPSQKGAALSSATTTSFYCLPCYLRDTA